MQFTFEPVVSLLCGTTTGSARSIVSRDVFLFSLIWNMASEVEAGNAATTEPESGEG